MTARFEEIVRPFQRPQVSFPTRIFDESSPAAVEDVLLELGKEGQTKTFSESFSQTVTTYEDQKSKELDRDTREKRITNPDDESQFVDVEIIDKLTVEAGKGRKYQKTTFELDND